VDFFLPVVALAAACAPDAGATITLRPDSTYQTIVGWESHTQSGEAEIAAFPLYKDELFDLAVNWLGITRLRLEAYSGIENDRDYWMEMRNGEIDTQRWLCARFETKNDDDDPNHIEWRNYHFSQLDYTVEQVVLPIREMIEARGEKLYLNVNYDAFVLKCPGTPYHHLEDLDEYAEFALATFIHLRDRYGLVPDGWEMILEADNTDWRGPAIGEAMVRTGRLLAEHGFHPDFIAPSNTEMAAAVRYFDEMVEVPGVLDYLDELSYHRYRGPQRADVEAIGERAVRHGIRTAMLEHIGSGHEDLHEDLAIGRNSAWQQFALAYGGRNAGANDNGGVYFPVNLADPEHPALLTGRRTHFLRQYFFFIRPGARRIGAGSTARAHEPLAFVNRDGGSVVVVKSDTRGTLDIVGLPAGSYATTYTTEGERGVVSPPISIAAGDTLRALIPDAGVLTVHPDTIT
jgi:hypothetical protein